MSQDTIKYLIDLIPEQDIETIYRVLIRFVPEDQGELEEFLEGREDRTVRLLIMK